MIINRDLLKIKMSEEKFTIAQVHDLIEQFSKLDNSALLDPKYFIFKGKIRNQAYSKVAEPIRILKKDGSIEDVALISDQLNLRALSKQVTRYFICFPKVLVKN